jgi:hypothetical protein
MANALDRLRESTTSLAGAASTLGAPTPTDPLSAQAMGASPNAAQMAGTPANKFAALRESAKESDSQGMDQKQEDHTKDTLLSKRMKEDAAVAMTTGKLTDRLSMITQEKFKAVATVTPIENLLSEEVKSDPEVKGAVSAFLKGDATGLERDAAIRTLVKRFPKKGENGLDYDQLSTASTIAGLTTILRNIGVKDMSELSVSKSLIDAFPPDLPIGQTLSPNNSANWEAVFGPGASPSALQDFITATGANINDNWANLGPKLKDWQKNKQQDWATLQEQSRSTNNAVRLDAQNKLRELGYLGVEASVEKLQGVTDAVTRGGQFKLGEVTFDTQALRAGDPQQKTQLTSLLTQAVAGTLTDKTLEAQLKEMMKSGTLEGLIDQADIAPIKALEEIHTSNMSLFKGTNPQDTTQIPVTMAVAKSYMTPEMFEQITTAKKGFTPAELPTWMKTLTLGGNSAVALNTVMNAAERYPGLKQFIQTADPGKLYNSQVLINPEVVIGNFAKINSIQNIAASASSGNINANSQLMKELFGPAPERLTALQGLPAPWGVTSLKGININQSPANIAWEYTNAFGGTEDLLNNPKQSDAFLTDLNVAAKQATEESIKISELLNQRINDLPKAEAQYTKLNTNHTTLLAEATTARQAASQAGIERTTLQQRLPYANSFERISLLGQITDLTATIDKAKANSTRLNPLITSSANNLQVLQDNIRLYKTSIPNMKAQYGPMLTIQPNGTVLPRTF